MFGIPIDIINVIPAVDSTVGSIASLTSVLSTAKETSKFFKSKLTLLVEFVIKFYKLLKLCIGLQFKEPKIYFENSRYVKCIFGYYRSKYLRRVFYKGSRITDFNFSAHNNFSTVYGGGI